MRSAKAVFSENPGRYGKPGYDMAQASRSHQYTLTALKRWSVANTELPAVSKIRAIHVYDFDNTLFRSPVPNPQLWHATSVGHLGAESHFLHGGWWHDPNILSATGKGIEEEEPRAWEGWWNENIIQLVRLSMEQKDDSLTVLLTGRKESRFADLVKRMVGSQNLKFDLIGLKPEVGPNGQRFGSTGSFKHAFLEDLVFTYNQAEEIRVYEDRPKHVEAFRQYFAMMNESLQFGQGLRSPISAQVIQVSEEAAYLDPVIEVAEIQRMINAHNVTIREPGPSHSKGVKRALRIKRTVIYTGYLISQRDSQRMVKDVLVPVLPPGLAESVDLKFMANNVLITPRPASNAILDKVGGFGKKLSWQITGTGHFENKVFAAQVTPIPENAQIYTENPVPLIVLAVRKGARPVEASRITNWQPLPPNVSMTFETEVGEKVVLRIEDDERTGPPSGPRNAKKRFHQDFEEDGPNHKTPHSSNYDSHSSNFHPYQRPTGDFRGPYEDNGPRRGSSSRGRGRGNGRGRGQPFRGRGGRGRGARDGPSNPHYRSLDDHNHGYHGGNEHQGGHNGGGYMDY